MKFVLDEIPDCAVVSYETFRNRSLECILEAKRSGVKYLMVKHHDENETLVCPEYNGDITTIFQTGIKSVEDGNTCEDNPFGTGVCCLVDRYKCTRDVIGEHPVYIKAKVWYQCVYSADNQEAFGKCLIRKSVKPANIKVFQFDKPIIFDSTQAMINMGFDTDCIRKMHIMMFCNKSLKNLGERVVRLE